MHRTLSASIVVAIAINAPAWSADPHPQWTLYTPAFGGTTTFLLDLDGDVVKTWPSNYGAGLSVYLADHGAIIRTAVDGSVAPFGGAGEGGRIERISWDGLLEWSYAAGGSDYRQHHDIEVLPNGNILALIWERFTRAEAIAMGRDPGSVGAFVHSEAVIEIEPTGPTSGTIVWEWHVWDHLVQDFDPKMPNFGAPSENADRIDINFGPSGADWLHCNGIDYNAALDQIVISSANFSEIWIISHDADHSGDLLYRWGNPRAYGRGTVADRKLFFQHNPEWILDGIPGAGHLTIFNNGQDRGYSSIDELDTGVNRDGTYDVPADGAYGPEDITWTCDSIDGEQYLARIMSGVQRLPNGNHLICLGSAGDFFEIDEACNTVWSYDVSTAVFRARRLNALDPRLQGLLWAAGDTDGDLDVDFEDLLTVLAAWESAGPLGDVDGSGFVDFADLLVVLAGWT